MTEWYRKNAGIVVFNKDKKVLICQRNDVSDSWQFPQGGIDEGESASEAALRELREETSLTNVTLVKTLDYPARYRFPEELHKKLTAKGITNAGQDMYWSLVYFNGSDTEINLNTDIPEFKQYRWANIEEAYELIVDFKKPAYEIMLKEFAALVKNYKE